MSSTSGTHQQDLLEHKLALEVLFDVGNQTDAIRIVAKNDSILKQKSVHRFGGAGAIGKLVGQFVCLVLEGNGNIATLVSFITQVLNGASKVVQRRFHGFIAHVLPRLFSEQFVDQRRFAMRDGVAYHCVFIGHPVIIS